MKILIRNLARTTTEDSLLNLFKTYGHVQYCTIVCDQETGESKGFGFVDLPKPGEAKAAIKNLNGQDFEGQVIRVKKAVKPKPGAQLYNTKSDA